MLSIGLLSLLIAVPLFSYRITPSLFNRITSVTLLYSAFLSYNALYVESIASGIGIYSGLFHVTTISLGIETFIFFVGAILLLGWAPVTQAGHGSTAIPSVNEYSLLILFTTIGASLLLSSSDIVSMYLSIELQSFAVYVLATLYRNSESATAAGLKYFLLGGLSSALILLGTAVIYSYTGLTQFENIYALTSVGGNEEYMTAVVLGILLIGIGFLFKVAAAPLHNWAPDVYDGTPTVVTAWLSTIPKISIFILLLEIQTDIGASHGLESLSVDIGFISIAVWKNLLLVTSLVSLVIGTILGLSQYRIKRLLTYSTISHVGFLLLALSINTQESVESLLFYIIQYTITNINVFLVLLAFGYIIHVYPKKDIQFVDSLKGQFVENPLLGFSFALCLFSIAGIPPLIGFFAKQIVLYSSTHGGYYFLSIVAILVSVISASYYLKIIKVIYFDAIVENTYDYKNNTSHSNVTSIHAFLISSLTIVITLFVLQPTILLNICHLLALSLFYYLVMNTITLFFIFIPILVTILLIANLLLAVHRPDSEKVTCYECGYSTIYGQTRNPFQISFFLVGILFTVLDLEIILFFPYASCAYDVQSYGFWIAIIFFVVLTVGFVYEFGIGALYFTDKRSSCNAVTKNNSKKIITPYRKISRLNYPFFSCMYTFKYASTSVSHCFSPSSFRLMSTRKAPSVSTSIKSSYIKDVHEKDSEITTTNVQIIARRHIVSGLPTNVNIINAVLNLSLTESELESLTDIKPFQCTLSDNVKLVRVAIQAIVGIGKSKIPYNIRVAGVYVFTNNKTGKQYVGSSINLAVRILTYFTPKNIIQGIRLIFVDFRKFTFSDYKIEIYIIQNGYSSKDITIVQKKNTSSWTISNLYT